jgi:hypothetical protein
MSPAVEDVARPALDVGVQALSRAEFQPSEARPLATDRLEGDAAVLVVRLRRDGAWIIDVVHFEATDHDWTNTGSSGATYGDLPFAVDEKATPEIVTLTIGTHEEDDRAVAYAGGFLSGVVEEIELVTATSARRVRPGPNAYAFVVIAPDAPEPHRVGLGFDPPEGPQVRAYSRGELVDDTAAWDRERQEYLEGTLTVAEALAAPPGTVVTVRGVLLQLEDQPALLCDDIDSDSRPPRPAGPAVQLTGPSTSTSSDPDSAFVSVMKMVATGVIRDGVLFPPAPTRAPWDA